VKQHMLRIARHAVMAATFTLVTAVAAAADRVAGQVTVGGVPIVGTEVTAWQAGSSAVGRKNYGNGSNCARA